MKNRLAEAYTGSKSTDECFRYSTRGEITDTYQHSPNSGTGMYAHLTASYWPNGLVDTFTGNLTGLPTLLTTTPDPEGRAYSITSSSGQSPVTETLYDGSSNVTQVNYGSHSGSDNDTFSYDPNTERPTGWTINVDAVNNLSYQATITNNTNGTVKGLNIADGFYPADSQNCTFTYDDLSRLLTHNCGTVWGASYTYDAYGNISKGMISGSPGTTFVPTYSAATNRFATIPSGTLSYDSAGSLTSDGFHTYGWDSDGNLISVGGVAGTFDALDRRVEVNNAGTYQQMLYPPFAPTFQMSLAQGLTAENLRIPLPGGGQAIYNSGGLAQYRHPNWQESEVVLSWPGGTPNPNVGGAFTAFGEKYATYPGGYNGYFAGMLGIADEGSIADAYQATARLYHQDEGRWVSPDPAGLGAVDFSNPQSWNRYAYALNNPLSNIDPSGLGNGTTYSGVDSQGNYWITIYCTYYSGVIVINVTGGPPPNPGQTGGGSSGGGAEAAGGGIGSTFACASEAASKVSIAGALQRFGIGKSGIGGFVTNALGRSSRCSCPRGAAGN